MKQVILGIGWLAAGLVFAAPAHADVDTDFANELHAYGNGQQDYNAGIGKIVCERLRIGVDPDAYETAQFISINIAEGGHHRADLAVPRRGASHLLRRSSAGPG